MCGIFTITEETALTLVQYFQARERLQKAEEALAADGLVITDRFKQQRPHPAASIARDSQALMLRALKALPLQPEGTKPAPAWSGGRKKRVDESPAELQQRHRAAVEKLGRRTQ